MIANVEKCLLLLSSVEDHSIGITEFTAKNSHCEKLLGVHFDNQLKSDFHIEKLCKNANRKLHSLARVTPYMDLSKKRILMNAFFDSQFNYCTWIWTCHRRNFIIKSTDYMKNAYAQFIMIKDLHMKNWYLKMILFLCAIKICKNLNEVFQFQTQNHHNLRNSSTFRIP